VIVSLLYKSNMINLERQKMADSYFVVSEDLFYSMYSQAHHILLQPLSDTGEIQALR